jgi:prepilin-type N-terminal cleavage/methylation domain
MLPVGSTRRAFTLIELLTVIAIIGVLGAILIPTVGSCREHARKSREVSAARQLMIAYHLAADENRGRLLPFQEQANTSVTGEGGRTITGITAKRWPHRIRPYLGDRFQATLYVNAQSDYYSDTAFDDDYTLSLRPTFGMNGSFVGGDDSPSNTLTVPPVRRLTEAALPAGLIVFASAHDRTAGPNAGNWRISSPISGFPVGAPNWPAEDIAGRPPTPGQDRDFGYVAFRWGGRAVTAFLDGHVALHTCAELRDMRLWSDAARRENNPAYLPH